MQKLLRPLSVLFFVFQSIACLADVPLAIRAAFKKQFPAAEKVKWEPGIGQFAAAFKLENKNISALFDDSGNLIETEEWASLDELPAQARTLIENQHPGKKVKEVKKVIRNRRWVFFKVKINGMDILFDAQGKQVVQEEQAENQTPE
jgi:hypothetical protein